MVAQDGSAEGLSILTWDPATLVRGVDPVEARLSRGFLRSRPEKWFPGFAAHWLPLAHSMGIELRIMEVKPALQVPSDADIRFAGTVDDEPVGLFVSDETRRTLLDVFSPGATKNASGVVMEYMARRFLGSLAQSWSGVEPSLVRFDSEFSAAQVVAAGTVKVSVMINSTVCTIWVVLGRRIVDRLDGLWRRQIRSSVKTPEQQANPDLRVEVAQLAVPQSMVSEYMKPGAIVDLEIPVTDIIALRLGNKPWLPARLRHINGKFACEIVPGPVGSSAVPEGTTRLVIEFGSMKLDTAASPELSQIGAVIETPIEVSDNVHMVINGSVVGKATLCCYEGRFAINVK